MPRPCAQDHPTPVPESCHLCNLYVTRADYHALWDGPGLTTITPTGWQWGDQLATALEAVGVTKERVSAWLGKPCGCPERQAKLNRLGAWFQDKSKAALEAMLGE